MCSESHILGCFVKGCVTSVWPVQLNLQYQVLAKYFKPEFVFISYHTLLTSQGPQKRVYRSSFSHSIEMSRIPVSPRFLGHQILYEKPWSPYHQEWVFPDHLYEVFWINYNYTYNLKKFLKLGFLIFKDVFLKTNY